MPSNLLIDSDIPEIDSREGRSSLLAQANTDELTSLVDRLLEEAELSSQLRIVRSPHTGTVQFQVREPVCEERFYLADVVVTVAEVAIGNHLGWAMRVGTDRRAALAAAIVVCQSGQVHSASYPVPERLQSHYCRIAILQRSLATY